MMTAVGAVPLLFFRKAGVQTQSALLGFAAGVMLAASFFSLIIPGVDVLQAGGASPAAAAGVMGAAVLIGATVIGLMNRFAPVDMLAIGPAGSRDLSRRIWLFIIAITLHNFPEGAAVGVSFGGGDMHQGLSTALGDPLGVGQPHHQGDRHDGRIRFGLVHVLARGHGVQVVVHVEQLARLLELRRRRRGREHGDPAAFLGSADELTATGEQPQGRLGVILGVQVLGPARHVIALVVVAARIGTTRLIDNTALTFGRPTA